MNLKKKISVAILALLAGTIVSAQLPDGVTGTGSFLDTLIKNYSAEKLIPFDLNTVNANATVPIRVMIIMNIKGSPGVTMNNIASGMKIANSYFKKVGISFFIDTVEYVSDYNYSYITYNNLRKELITQYASGSRIDLFLADSIKLGPNRSYGFTYFPDTPDSNLIFLDKTFASGNGLATMLGHFMGLLPTHESGRGRELANEMNCDSSGDYICDTYADPGLFNQVIDTCKYIGSERDDIGNYFIPSVANLMSDSPDQCRCILTPQQYRRIYYYFLKYRQYLRK